MNELICYRVET